MKKPPPAALSEALRVSLVISEHLAWIEAEGGGSLRRAIENSRHQPGELALGGWLDRTYKSKRWAQTNDNVSIYRRR